MAEGATELEKPSTPSHCSSSAFLKKSLAITKKPHPNHPNLIALTARMTRQLRARAEPRLPEPIFE